MPSRPADKSEVTHRGRVLLAGTGLLVAVWSALQLWLTHRLAAAFYAKSIAGCAQFVREHPDGKCYPLSPVTSGDWLPYALASIAVLVALAATAAILVRGGRRSAALIVAAMPAANFLGAWHDGRMLGAGWVQLSDDNLTSWTVAGMVVDTAVVTIVVLALMLTVRPADRSRARAAGLLRVVPPAVVLTGWWLMRHPLPERLDEIWLVQALAFTLAVGLLWLSGLSLWVRALGTLVVLPLTTWPIGNAAIGSRSMGEVVHHAAFAAGTAAMVVGLPRLIAALRSSRSSRPAAATPVG
jgi:hypothetical protein